MYASDETAKERRTVKVKIPAGVNPLPEFLLAMLNSNLILFSRYGISRTTESLKSHLLRSDGSEIQSVLASCCLYCLKIRKLFYLCRALEEVPSSGNAMTRPIGNMAHIAGFAFWMEHLRFFSRGHRFMEPLGFSRMIGKCESGPIYNSQYWSMNSFKDSFSSFAIRKRSSGVSRISSRLMQHFPHCVQ